MFEARKGNIVELLMTEADKVFRTWLDFAKKNSIHIATLGPRGTSSGFAAASLLKHIEKMGGNIRNSRINFFHSYEQATQEALTQERTILLVANAYAAVNEMYMNPTLMLAGAFILPTPPYGIVGRAGTSMRSRVRIASHPAPIPLIHELLPPSVDIQEIIEAASTSEAARLVAQKQVDCALTNEIAANQFQLRFISSKRAIRMLWSIFVPRTLFGEVA